MAGIGELLRRAKLWQAIRILSACALAYAIPLLLGLPEGY